MGEAKTYCDFVKNLEKGNVHRIYHDQEYGFPLKSDDELFGRLILEINQAGLSWSTILNKKENFRLAYSNFSIEKIARYKVRDINRLLADAGIIRNKLKVNAAVFNANRVLAIQSEDGSFKKWLDNLHPLPLNEWVKAFKSNFKFTGGEITKEFLTSSGYLKGAHTSSCPIFQKALKKKPMWSR
ncbi:MAG: DNA-3-methyladenine glycosylase I [Oligoflexales bacterium]